MQKESKTVAHIRKTFFDMSENWIYTQIKYLIDWSALVLTQNTKNLNSVDDKPELFARHEDFLSLIRLLDGGFKRALKFYPSYYYLSKKNKITLIHAHFGQTGYDSLKLAKVLKVPLITTFYGVDISLVPKRNPDWVTKYEKLFKDGALFLAEGSAMKRQLTGMGCPKEKIKIQHLGVETDDFKPRTNYSSDTKLRILMAGRFVEKKGFLYGLKGFKKFIEDGGNATLSIIGDSTGLDQSETTTKNMKDYVEANNLQEFVKFLGMVPLKKLQAAYYKHDIFLSPSVEAQDGDNEGGAPVSIIEASATGMPIVGTFHCDIPEVVRHEKTGFLCEEKDSKAIAEYLMYFQDNRDIIKKMGEQAAAHIREHYDAEKQGKKLSDIYTNAIKS
jgi:colanic acid/amylovoran biosynthesis glycosyltransferase